MVNLYVVRSDVGHQTSDSPPVDEDGFYFFNFKDHCIRFFFAEDMRGFILAEDIVKVFGGDLSYFNGERDVPCVEALLYPLARKDVDEQVVRIRDCFDWASCIARVGYNQNNYKLFATAYMAYNSHLVWLEDVPAEAAVG